MKLFERLRAKWCYLWRAQHQVRAAKWAQGSCLLGNYDVKIIVECCVRKPLIWSSASLQSDFGSPREGNILILQTWFQTAMFLIAYGFNKQSFSMYKKAVVVVKSVFIIQRSTTIACPLEHSVSCWLYSWSFSIILITWMAEQSFTITVNFYLVICIYWAGWLSPSVHGYSLHPFYFFSFFSWFLL